MATEPRPELAQLEAAADALDQAHERRDQLVREAVAGGVPPAHIARAVRLSRAHVYRIANASGS